MGEGAFGYLAPSGHIKTALGFPGEKTGACAQPRSVRWLSDHHARSASAAFLLCPANARYPRLEDK